jgi:hypothetical protein
VVGQVEHEVEHDLLDATARRARAPVLRAMALWAIACRASSVKVSLAPSNWKSCWYCLTSAFLGSVRICTRASIAQRHERRDDGQSPDELGDDAELDDVLVADLLEQHRARGRRSGPDVRASVTALAAKPILVCPIRGG